MGVKSEFRSQNYIRAILDESDTLPFTVDNPVQNDEGR